MLSQTYTSFIFKSEITCYEDESSQNCKTFVHFHLPKYILEKALVSIALGLVKMKVHFLSFMVLVTFANAVDKHSLPVLLTKPNCSKSI